MSREIAERYTASETQAFKTRSRGVAWCYIGETDTNLHLTYTHTFGLSRIIVMPTDGEIREGGGL